MKSLFDWEFAKGVIDSPERVSTYIANLAFAPSLKNIAIIVGFVFLFFCVHFWLMVLMQQKLKGDETIITFLHQASSISPSFSLEVCVFYFCTILPLFLILIAQIDGIEEEKTLLEVARFVGSNPVCLSSLKISRVLFTFPCFFSSF